MSANFEKSFQDLIATLTSDVEKEKFCNDPLSKLAEVGIPIVTSFEPSRNALAVNLSDPAVLSDFFQHLPQGTSPLNGASCTASCHWWGVEVDMNEEMTKNVIEGIIDIGAFGEIVTAALGALSAVTGGVAAAVALALAAIIFAKQWQIKLVDRGNGVQFRITWVQWGLLVAAIPGGITAIVAAGMALIHPESL